jgi:hypothetical protein
MVGSGAITEIADLTGFFSEKFSRVHFFIWVETGSDMKSAENTALLTS